MLNRRFKLHGLFAVLLALSVQLGVAASVPKIQPAAGATVLCHTDTDPNDGPAQIPSNTADCLVCPLCVVLQAQFALPDEDSGVHAPRIAPTIIRSERPASARAPPPAFHPSVRPRGPPLSS